MNPFLAFFAVLCVVFVVGTFLAFEIAIFRLACTLSAVPRPAYRNSFLLVGILLIVPGIVDGFGYAILQTIYRASRYPLWEADLVQFFIALPVHLAICSWIHARVMRIPITDALGVWFVEKLLKIAVIVLAVGIFGIMLLIGRLF